jgi:hypothetical protein
MKNPENIFPEQCYNHLTYQPVAGFQKKRNPVQRFFLQTLLRGVSTGLVTFIPLIGKNILPSKNYSPHFEIKVVCPAYWKKVLLYWKNSVVVNHEVKRADLKGRISISKRKQIRILSLLIGLMTMVLVVFLVFLAIKVF